MSEKLVYDFDEHCEGGRELLGGKGLGLAEMTQLGLPVPARFHRHDRCVPAVLDAQAGPLPRASQPRSSEHLARPGAADRASASAIRRSRCSSRSAPAGRSRCPGMMETILNLGLTDEVVRRAGELGELRFLLDAYRRLIQMYGEVVAGIEPGLFASRARAARRERTDRAAIPS